MKFGLKALTLSLSFQFLTPSFAAETNPSVSRSPEISQAVASAPAAVAILPQVAQNAAYVPKRLRIAYVIDVIDEAKSGAVVSAQRFLKELRKYHDVTVVATGKEAEGKLVMRPSRRPFPKKKMRENGMVFAHASKKKLTELYKNIDLVYTQMPFFFEAKAAKLARKMGIPVISGFHVQPENILYNIGIKWHWLNMMVYNHFIKSLYNPADVVVCPSKFAEKQLVNNRHFKGRTMVISNGLTSEFRPTPSEKYPEYEGKFVILTVGRLAKEKRHDVIINAINKSKYRDKIQLVIAGRGELEKNLVKLGSVLPNPPRLGFVEDKELVRLYNASDLYVHASEVELEGMSVLQAIGCGLPAVIADAKASASAQFVLEDKSGKKEDKFVFNAGDAHKLSENIDYWIEHQEELKQKGREYAEMANQYRFEVSVDQTNRLFETVAAKRQMARVADQAGSEMPAAQSNDEPSASSQSQDSQDSE